MLNLEEDIEIGLQISFGPLGLGLALAAIHYRDWLGSILLRRCRHRGTESKKFHRHHNLWIYTNKQLGRDLEAGFKQVEIRVPESAYFPPITSALCPASYIPACYETSMMSICERERC
jgi:hypothetical protein